LLQTTPTAYSITFTIVLCHLVTGVVTHQQANISNGFVYSQLQLLPSVSSGILHGKNDFLCDEMLVYCSQYNCDEFNCKHDEFQSDEFN